MRDAKQILSDAQTLVINAAANANSTNVLDLDQALGKDFMGTARTPDPSGLTSGPVIEVVITTSVVAAGAGTLTIGLYNHTAATSINSGTLIDSVVLTTATSASAANGTTAGSRHTLYIKADKVTKRYLGLDYAVATQNVTAGACDAAIVAAGEKLYP